jgi:hypothetical protein
MASAKRLNNACRIVSISCVWLHVLLYQFSDWLWHSVCVTLFAGWLYSILLSWWRNTKISVLLLAKACTFCLSLISDWLKDLAGVSPAWDFIISSLVGWLVTVCSSVIGRWPRHGCLFLSLFSTWLQDNYLCSGDPYYVLYTALLIS